MNNYKALMAKVDAIIEKQNKALPISTSGLLSPKGKPSKVAMDSPEAQIAKYVAIIRKQREELVK